MFKPSLRRSLLNDKLFVQLQSTKTSFSQPQQFKSKPVQRFKQLTQIPCKIETPSMLIPQQILQKNQFYKSNNFTDVFTPLSYDFKPYPRAIKQIIKHNPKSAQAGRIGQINYIVYQKILALWTNTISNNNQKQTQFLKIHKFQQKIDLVQISTIKNTLLFKKPSVIIIALSFSNRISLYKVQQEQLELQDLMLKYKLRNSNKIQRLKFTQTNELVFGGDSGQISIISFNKERQISINIKTSIIKKYLSKSAFDYSTRHIIKDIGVNNNFVYCLKDKISKSNYCMYYVKNMINKIVKLSQKPKYIHVETFIDIYKVNHEKKAQIVFCSQIKENQIQKKIKQGYNNFWGEGVDQGFKIVSIHGVSEKSKDIVANQSFNDKKNQKQQTEKDNKKVQLCYANPKITLTTKCGYMITLVHDQNFLIKKQSQMENQTKQNFSFLSQPLKLPQFIGEASLFQAKTFSSATNQKNNRKNHLVQSFSNNPHQFLLLFNNSLMYKNRTNLSMIKFDDLKKNISQTTTYQQSYMDQKSFEQAYQKPNNNRSRDFGMSIQSDPSRNLFQAMPYQNRSKQCVKLFNNQRRWTVFDNQGRFHIYNLQVKHIILTYLYYQCEHSTHNNYQFIGHSSNNSMLESDWKIHSVIQKLIKIYGYCTLIKSLIEILAFNSVRQRQYFYMQKQTFLQVIKKEFQYYLPTNFQDWNYNLNQHNKSTKVVVTKRMLQFVWILLYEYQYKIPLTTELIISQSPKSQYKKLLSQYSDINTKLNYSSYGYALKSLFFNIIEPIVYLKANQFKQKQQKINKCKKQLSMLMVFLENKKKKSETYEYRNYLSMKLKNLRGNKKELFSARQVEQNNQTFSTNYSNSMNNDQSLIFNNQPQRQSQINKKTQSTQQSNQTVQKSIFNSIKKIGTLLNVMHILIQKDERQGLPNFIEIVTNIKNQIRIGQIFFNEQLFISDQTIQFIHPELVRQVEITLPQLQLTKKIDYLKFKSVRNIAFSNQMTQIDLKSLNLQKLSCLISARQIPQLRAIFLGKKCELTSQKILYYIQFLSISLSKLIKSVRQLSSIKQKNFMILSPLVKFQQQKRIHSQQSNHISIQKILISNQKLQYYQEQMILFYEEIKNTFSSLVKQIRNTNGPKYYEYEKYLEKVIEILVDYIGFQEILVQQLEMVLKSHCFIDKIQYLEKYREKTMVYKDKKEKPILSIIQEKEFKFNQKSTFQLLSEKRTTKTLPLTDQTQDTERNASFRM